jgi:hypothetical protein
VGGGGGGGSECRGARGKDASVENDRIIQSEKWARLGCTRGDDICNVCKFLAVFGVNGLTAAPPPLLCGGQNTGLGEAPPPNCIGARVGGDLPPPLPPPVTLLPTLEITGGWVERTVRSTPSPF